MSTQCFVCLSYLPSELKGTSKRAVVSILNNFKIEIDDLIRVNGGCKLDKDNENLREQLVQNLSICSKCLTQIKLVVSSKSKVDRVENSVRKLQLDLLKQLNKLEKCVEGLREEMEVIGGIIQNSSGEDGGKQTGANNDMWSFRNDILDVKEHLQLFKDGKRNSTTVNCPDNQDSSPRPPTSIQIKTEPETTHVIPNNYDEHPTDLNLMEDYYDDHCDSPPSAAEAFEEASPQPPTLPEKNENISVDSKSTPKTKRKYSKLPNKCTKCSKTFTLKTDLQTHQKRYHPKDRLKEKVSCPHCHETMSCRVLLRTHKLYHCPFLKKDKPQIFPCTICKITLPNVEDLKEHNLEMHVEKLRNMCETCGKISVSRQAHQMHQNTHEDPRNRQVVECEDCGKIILTSSIGSHRRLGCPKRENGSFLCKICGKYFSNESNLGKHVRRMHNGEKTKKDGSGQDKLIGYRRKIKVIAEEDKLEDKKDKHVKEKVEDSGSEFIPPEGEMDEKFERKSRRGRRPGAPMKCPKCPRTFTWAMALKNHKITYHKNDWLLEPTHCPNCLEAMPRKLLRTHQFYHCPVKSRDIIYSCTLCKPTLEVDTGKLEHPIFADLQSLKNHVATQHPRKMLSLICDICGLISKCVYTHDKHQIRHVNPKDREFVECEACGKSILSTSLSSHRRLGCPKRERTSFPCIYCTKMFSTEMAVVNHVNRWHTGINGELILKPRRPKILQCHLCGKWIQDKAGMRRHLRGGHHKSWEERGEDKVVCEFCGREMLGVNLAKHERYHCGGREREGGGEGVTCEICGKGFRNEGILRWHRKGVHGDERFVCELCGRVFKVRSLWKKHLERHKGLRRFECELGCGARFTQKMHLKRHLGLNRCLGEGGPRKGRKSNLEIEAK